MVWQKVVNRRTIKEVAKNLYVAVCRVVDRFERIGRVASNQPTPRAHTLHEHDELISIELVSENPSVYLREIQTKLMEATRTVATLRQP